jgi:uncharacterized protein (TIGR00255 family)
MRLPEVVKSDLKDMDEKEWQAIFKTSLDAMKQLDLFRIQEGKVLEKDLSYRVNLIISLLKNIEPFENERIQKIRDRISQNLKDNLDSNQLDNNRYEQEIILYLEKLDITEEKIRLLNHCTYFLETMVNEEMTGKKLGFISQEIGREINTIGSKANHSEIQKIVVQMKDELEKVKEQLLNIL